MGKMIVLKVDGTRVEQECSVCPRLDILQAGVEGSIETVPFFFEFEGKECKAYCDEEGKLKNKPINRVATELWKAQVGIVSDVLVGDVVVLTGDRAFLRTI